MYKCPFSLHAWNVIVYIYINSYVQEENLYWTFKVLVLKYAE